MSAALNTSTDDRPISTEASAACVRGAVGNRLAIILRTPGCAYDLKPGGGCTFCSFRTLTTGGRSVNSLDLIRQVQHTLANQDCEAQRIFEIDLYSSGNFLNDDEIPQEARVGIFACCASERALRLILVESRPEYITEARLIELHRAIEKERPPAIEVGIGLESVDDAIRERQLKKGFTRKSFERAVAVLGQTQTDLLVYILLKPTVMSEQHAVQEAIETAEYVYEVADRYKVRARLALEPTFVVPGTALAGQYLEGSYTPPSLWSVVDVAKQLACLGDLLVGLWDEGLNPLAIPGSCDRCRQRIIRALMLFNAKQDVNVLDVRRCTCQRSQAS
jgi:radical SAM enzyme (TIGR01210 family)